MKSIATSSCEWLNLNHVDSANDEKVIAVLAEKLFLVLETLRSHASDDKAPIVISTAPHSAIKLPRRKQTSPEAAT